MDKDLIFYIILALIYLLSRAGRKKRQQRKQVPPSPPSPQQSQRTSQSRPTSAAKPKPAPVTASNPAPQSREEKEVPMSFEDILRELSGEGRRTVEPPAPEPETYEVEPEPATTYERSFEEIVESDISEEASELWSAYGDLKRKPAKESSKEEKQKIKSFQRFDVYNGGDDANSLTQQIRDMLQDDEDTKKAIVLSEILNRKY